MKLFFWGFPAPSLNGKKNHWSRVRLNPNDKRQPHMTCDSTHPCPTTARILSWGTELQPTHALQCAPPGPMHHPLPRSERKVATVVICDQGNGSHSLWWVFLRDGGVYKAGRSNQPFRGRQVGNIRNEGTPPRNNLTHNLLSSLSLCTHAPFHSGSLPWCGM